MTPFVGNHTWRLLARKRRVSTTCNKILYELVEGRMVFLYPGMTKMLLQGGNCRSFYNYVLLRSILTIYGYN